MPSFEFVLLTIFACGLATWTTRVLPFILLKKFDLPQPLIEYLQFVPIVIMSALWFSELFTQQLGHLPTLNSENLWASLPTFLSAILSKSLFVIVLIGILSLAAIRYFF